jgi:hypothetical protein
MSPRLISIVDPKDVKTTDESALVGDALRAFLND